MAKGSRQSALSEMNRMAFLFCCESLGSGCVNFVSPAESDVKKKG